MLSSFSLEDIAQDLRQNFSAAEARVEELLHYDGKAVGFLQLFNTLGIHLDRLGALSSLMSNVHPSSAVRELAETYEQKASDFTTGLTLNKDLYQRFFELDTQDLSPVAQRLVVKTIQDFERSGVNQEEMVRERIKVLQAELTLLAQQFSRHIREDKRTITLSSAADLAGLPADYIASHTPETGAITISTDYPDFHPFMRYAKNKACREKLSFEFANRAYPRNMEVLEKLLQQRQELAGLLGFANWADYVSENKMVETGKNIAEFIDRLVLIATPRAAREYEALLEYKQREEPTATTLAGWESGYYEEQYSKEKYAFDSQAVRAYFEYNRVKQGLLELTSELFGITFRRQASAVVWHGAVEVYDVYDGAKQLGTIYLDMHPRENKYGHAAQFSLQSGVKDVQLPVGVLVCNFTDPSASEGAALLDHDQVTTFFHEFGHLLHHILGGQQEYIRFSGVATEWDFVEAPSQFFEEWAWDMGVLSRFAHHYETNEVIPADLVQRLKAAKEFGEGLFVRQQTFYAAVSLYYHYQVHFPLDTTALLQALQARYGNFPYREGTHFQANFGHLEGYSAVYYTYMWSLVIAKDLAAGFKNGLLDTAAAMKYRKTILEPGGSKDAAELVVDFLGRPYSLEAFQGWLERF